MIDRPADLPASPTCNDRRRIVSHLSDAAQRARGAVTAARFTMDRMTPPLDLRQPVPEALEASLRHAKVELDLVLSRAGAQRAGSGETDRRRRARTRGPE